MTENISPEEKLLRLIRGQKKQEKAIEKKSVISATDTARTPVKQTPIARYAIYPVIQKFFSFFYIRRIIFVVFASSCIYLFLSFIYPWFGLKRIKLPEVRPAKIIDKKIELPLDVRPFEFYQEGIKRRQIFESLSIPETQISTVAPSSIGQDLIKDINLVGIIAGENPQAVIEDKKTQKTYYLNRGQFMGEFLVEDIQEGKIILNYKGQRFELYM